MQRKEVDILIVGAGIIGTSIGAELSRRGASVCVIDKGNVGRGCSYGNAGWMTPCFSMPLPMPGMLMKSMKWMLDPAGPLYIKPSFSLDLASWLFHFMKAMNATQARRAVDALVVLSQKSLIEYEKLGQKYPEIRFEQKGLLMASRTPAGVAAAVEELEYVKDVGVPGKKLTGEEILAMEPALKGPLLGGVYFSQEGMGEPFQVVQAMASEIRKNGGEILENCELLDLEMAGNKVDKVLTSQGEIKAKQVVIATGSWSKSLAKLLRLRIPILGGKGYAMILPKLEKQPTYPIMIVEKKIAVTPRENTLRIAGTLELVDQDFSITQRRVDNIKNGAREFLRLPDTLEVQELWAGLRPCTPDGVPLIGYHKDIPNLMLAVGHQMLGLQSGAGTGLLVADLMENKKPFVDLGVLDVNRF
ncbi:NAD(P)/FAD-dependent oxidoreductase [Bdellovibrio svalbardensis]|uniref:FAD-dependent oxidoreductase n=1 Tax=Bdellovibrio svalbardensis TaxID=2972972 RepID=A0ABT6DHC8_9BACT|nr:FAD-dependent oxidoreductase [Bdellovibrio svalbardensis]MDG0816263.1 FAD-dependent oxidoreductase [Bdellovibrio svalbardensis]